MSLDIRNETHGEIQILALAGRLDTETSADLELALQDLQAAGASQFLIDLADIGYVSSAGLRVLLALAKQLEGGRGSLKLCALNDSVRQVFEVAGFTRLFAIFPSRDAAFGAAAAPSKPRESTLTRTAATLLGAPAAPTAPASPESAALARSAAQLLGAEKAPTTQPADKRRSKAPAPPPPAAVPPESETTAGGVLGKFRNLFGKK